MQLSSNHGAVLNDPSLGNPHQATSHCESVFLVTGISAALQQSLRVHDLLFIYIGNARQWSILPWVSPSFLRLTRSRGLQTRLQTTYLQPTMVVSLSRRTTSLWTCVATLIQTGLATRLQLSLQDLRFSFLGTARGTEDPQTSIKQKKEHQTKVVFFPAEKIQSSGQTLNHGQSFSPRGSQTPMHLAMLSLPSPPADPGVLFLLPFLSSSSVPAGKWFLAQPSLMLLKLKTIAIAFFANQL